MNADQSPDRRQIEARLRSDIEGLRSLGVRSLSLFGSVARGEGGPGSDVDLLVEFEPPVRYARYCDLKDRLEALLGRRVDLLTTGALRDELRPTIERDLLRVA